MAEATGPRNPEEALPRRGSGSKKITFVEVDPVPLKQTDVLVPKRMRLMVRVLVLDVLAHSRAL